MSPWVCAGVHGPAAEQVRAGAAQRGGHQLDGVGHQLQPLVLRQWRAGAVRQRQRRQVSRGRGRGEGGVTQPGITH